MASVPPDAQLCPTCFSSLRNRSPKEWRFNRSLQRHRKKQKRGEKKTKAQKHLILNDLRIEVFWLFSALHLVAAAYKEYPLHQGVYQVCVLELVLKQVDLLYLKIYFLIHLLDMHLGC